MRQPALPERIKGELPEFGRKAGGFRAVRQRWEAVFRRERRPASLDRTDGIRLPRGGIAAVDSPAHF